MYSDFHLHNLTSESAVCQRVCRNQHLYWSEVPGQHSKGSSQHTSCQTLKPEGKNTNTTYIMVAILYKLPNIIGGTNCNLCIVYFFTCKVYLIIFSQWCLVIDSGQ